MREIKFKIWNTLLKKMFDSKDIYDLTDCRDEKHFGCYFDKKINIFLQFTGLQDVTGKDIYEGDIVDVGKVMERHCLIEYKKAKFILKFQDDFETGSPTDIDIFLERIRIIGNIYENPELVMSN